MKKAILLASGLILLTSLPASAQIVFQPTIIAAPPPAVVVETAPAYIIERVPYPVHIDHHHHYDWRYWHDHREHVEYRRR